MFHFENQGLQGKTGEKGRFAKRNSPHARGRLRVGRKPKGNQINGKKKNANRNWSTGANQNVRHHLQHSHGTTGDPVGEGGAQGSNRETNEQAVSNCERQDKKPTLLGNEQVQLDEPVRRTDKTEDPRGARKKRRCGGCKKLWTRGRHPPISLSVGTACHVQRKRKKRVDNSSTDSTKERNKVGGTGGEGGTYKAHGRHGLRESNCTQSVKNNTEKNQGAASTGLWYTN